MTYNETRGSVGVTIALKCDARRSNRQICSNLISVTMQSHDKVTRFLLGMGWGLLRGRQVCPACLRRGRVVFPRSEGVA